MKIETVEITPAMANKWLEESNVGNRNISKIKLYQYVNDMKNGNWKFNGDTIRFDNRGVLIDGQHRLTAIVKSGMSQTAIVITGLESDSKHTIDTGKLRSGGDALSISMNVSPAVSHVISGALRLHYFYVEKGSFATGGGHLFSNSDTLNHFKKLKPLVFDCLEFMDSELPVRFGLLLPRSIILFLLMVFFEINKEEAKEFARKVFSGTGLMNGDTEKNIRDILIEKKAGTRKLNQKTLCYSVISAWNSVRRGNTSKQKGNCVWRASTGHVKAI